MTTAEQSQNARIAEAMGKTQHGWFCRQCNEWVDSIHVTNDERHDREMCFTRVEWVEDPDYLHSDDAAREMRESLSEEERLYFANILAYNLGIFLVSGAKDWFAICNATPRQQAEAYCRVKGIKWEVEG